MLEVHDVHVGLRDFVVGGPGCKQIIDDFTV